MLHASLALSHPLIAVEDPVTGHVTGCAHCAAGCGVPVMGLALTVH